MWILECDGDILRGNRIWLRPGNKYLFGRTKPDDSKYAGFTIAHKSVSRKHLTLSVTAVKPGAGSLVHTKSELSLEDENTKVGTEIDGEKVRGDKRILKNDEHVFRLGSYEFLFRIKWQPVVLSFTFPSKETKGGKDPLIPIRSRLEDIDVKTIIPYIVDTTTHVVASKRNTAKGLQALINGKFIVDTSYLDAIIFATTPGNLDEPESLSPLEEDFAANWPSPAQHLPAPGREPGQRPAELFEPNRERKEIFQGYTFVFCNLRQFENLQAPITNGAGKALLFTITMGETAPREIVRFVKHAAGERGVGEFQDGSKGKGVVLVRFQGDKGSEDWAIQTQEEIAQMLDHRLIEQNEFLDAILTNEPSKLRRALPVGYEGGAALQLPNAGSQQHRIATRQSQVSQEGEAPPSTQPQASKSAWHRGRPRGNIVSAFKGFDDAFDPSQVVREGDTTGIGSQFDGGLHGTSQWRSNSPSAINSQLEIDSQDAIEPVQHARKSRKRPLQFDNEQNEEDINDSLFPAAAAMKRRKIQDEEEARLRGQTTEYRPGKSLKKVSPPQEETRARKEIDVQEVVRKRKEREEEAARRNEEDQREGLEGVDIEGIRNLAVVEEMEVLERTNRPQQRAATGHDSERWDERWNGRKNFKKFHRQGQGDRPRRGPSVIVPLEEVRKKSHGIGKEYWLENEKSRKKRKEKDQASQSQSQPFTTARSQAEEVPAELLLEGESEVIDVDAPRTTRAMDSSLHTEHATDRSQVASGKRPASGSMNGGSAKRQRVFAAKQSDTDSEDDLKFRFKKRR